MIRCGDMVRHRPSGEIWTVAYVDGDRLAWCGWPYGEAAVADCELVESCTDHDHIEMLRQIEGSSTDDRRPRMARAALEQIAGTKKNPDYDRLAQECEEAEAECQRTYVAWGEATNKLQRLEREKRDAFLALLEPLTSGQSSE